MQFEEYGKMRALEDHYWWFVSRRRLAKSMLKKYAPTATCVLDLGCGTGALLNDLSSTMTPTGLDFSDQATAFCRERGLSRVVQGDAQHLPFRPATFEAIISLDTLEHVPDDVQAARELANVMKKGSIVIVNVPAYKWLWGPHDVALMHHRRYTKSQLRSLLQNAGLRVEKVSYSVFFLFPIVVLIRAIDKLKSGPAEVRLPAVAGPVNSALGILQDIEARMILNFSLPWGSSVVAVARKVD